MHPRPYLPRLASLVGAPLSRGTGFVVLSALALALVLAAAPATISAAGLEVAHAAKSKGKKGGKKGKARCPKAKVRLATGGKVKCVKPKAVKPIKSKKSTGLRNAELLIGGVKLPPIKLVRKGKSYGTYRGPLSKPAQKRLQKAIAAAEKKLKTATVARVRQLPATEGGAAASASGAGAARASAAASGASASAVREYRGAEGLDSFRVEWNEQTGEWKSSGSAETELKLDNGSSATVEVTAETKGNSNVSLGEPDLEIGVKIEVADGTSVSGTSFKLKVPPLNSKSSTPQSCPAADGAVKQDVSVDGAESGSYLADRIGKLEIDSVTTSSSTSSAMKSEYTMTDSARLPARLPFRTNIKFNYALTAKILGIKVRNIRITATGTASGAVDSKTGQIAPGANIDVKVSASGIPGSHAQAPMTSMTLSLMRSAIGKLHEDAKKLEKKALQGDCTKIVFDPKTFSKELTNGETANVEARLETREGGKTVSGPVRMLAVPHAGKVSYAEAARANPASMTVTAGAEERSPSEVRVSLISRAGVSRATWNAKLNRFPKRYSGPISYEYAYTPVPGVTDNMRGKATVTYELMEHGFHPDGSGSVQGRYEAISADLSEIGHEQLTGDGTCRLALKPNPRPPASQELRFGELEIVISPTGQWSSGVVLDIDAGEMPAELVCDGFPPTSGSIGPHFVFNSRLPSIPGLRPMSPAGPIAGSGVTDIQATIQPGFTANASWSLQPQH